MLIEHARSCSILMVCAERVHHTQLHVAISWAAKISQEGYVHLDFGAPRKNALVGWQQGKIHFCLPEISHPMLSCSILAVDEEACSLARCHSPEQQKSGLGPINQ